MMEKFLKFGVVGIINTLITIGFYTLFVYLGMNYIIANILSYFIGMLNSFIWNKKWVFQVQSGNISTFVKFVIVNLVTLSFNTLCLFILVNQLHLHTSVAQILSTGAGLVINFVLNKKWTFDEKGKIVS